VTGPGLPNRDRADVEALIADHYLDALLAAADRHAVDAPADALLDPELRDASRVLRRALIRLHPSFRFEERLAGRLAELAAAQARPLAATGGGAGTVIPFVRTGDALDATDPLLAVILAGELDPAGDAALDAESRLAPARRPLIVGGAITSAAISLVGVAWVAWHAARPTNRGEGAMGRAARAAHARRAAAANLTSGGIGGPA